LFSRCHRNAGRFTAPLGQGSGPLEFLMPG
jgi:hypothetical protein